MSALTHTTNMNSQTNSSSLDVSRMPVSESISFVALHSLLHTPCSPFLAQNAWLCAGRFKCGLADVVDCRVKRKNNELWVMRTTSLDDSMRRSAFFQRLNWSNSEINEISLAEINLRYSIPLGQLTVLFRLDDCYWLNLFSKRFILYHSFTCLSHMPHAQFFVIKQISRSTF